MIDAVSLTETDAKRTDAIQVHLSAHFAALGHELRAHVWQVGLNPVYPSLGKK